jgi:5'-methylthioadenosine/S-adenosylhomocysteine nucleosidase
MLALLGALKEEIVDLRKDMALEEAFTWQGCHIYHGEYRNKAVLLVQTGIGKERAEAATRFILEHYPVTALVSLGFAGALTEELKVGDIILCSTLCCANGLSKGNPCSSDARLVSLSLQALGDAAIGLCQGRSATVAQLVSSPEAKLALAKAFHADIVDMESYWIGKIASASQVPFLAVRAISDTVQDSLLPFDQIMDFDGKWRWQRATIYFLSRPQNLPKLFTLYRNARRARKSLTAFIEYLIAEL